MTSAPVMSGNNQPTHPSTGCPLRARAVGCAPGAVGLGLGRLFRFLVWVFFEPQVHCSSIVGLRTRRSTEPNTPGGGRTRAGPGLSRLPLPLGYGGKSILPRRPYGRVLTRNRRSPCPSYARGGLPRPGGAAPPALRRLRPAGGGPAWRRRRRRGR